MNFGNGRVWLDKTQLHETFGAFSDQKFYSVEYVGDDVEAVAAFAAQVAEFQAWCKAAYHAHQGGAALPATPAFVAEQATPEGDVVFVEEVLAYGETPEESDESEG